VIGLVIGLWRGSGWGDRLRLATTVALGTAAALLLLCAFAWSRSPRDSAGTALAVLGAVGYLSAVGTRISRATRPGHSAVLLHAGTGTTGVRALAALETGLAVFLGTVAGLQAHLTARGLFSSTLPRDKAAGSDLGRLLAVGSSISLPALLTVAVGLVGAAACGAAFAAAPVRLSGGTPAPGSAPARALERAQERAQGRAPFALWGPVSLAVGLTVHLADAPGRFGPDWNTTWTTAWAAAGTALTTAGAGLSAPWAVHRLGALLALRTRRPALLCTGRRLQQDARPLAVPLALSAATGAALLLGLSLDVPGSRSGTLNGPFLVVVAAGAVCALVGLATGLAERAGSRRADADTLYVIGAHTGVARRAAFGTAVLPLAGVVCSLVPVLLAVLAHRAGPHGAVSPAAIRVAAGAVAALAAVVLPAAVWTATRSGVRGTGESTGKGRGMGKTRSGSSGRGQGRVSGPGPVREPDELHGAALFGTW
jgi:hypothetical protein